MSPRARGGQWKQGVRREAAGTWTAKHGQRWSRGHPTRDAALKAKADLANRVEEERSGRSTVKEWADRWLDVRPRNAESSNQWYRERISVFVRENASTRLTDVSVEDCQTHALQFPARVKAVRAMFADAVTLGVDGLEVSPWARVKVPSKGEGRRRVHPLTRQEVQQLVDLCPQVLPKPDWGRVVYGAMVLTAAWTGMRPGELFALEWRDVDWERGTVHVRRQYRTRTRELVPYTKNGRDRVVPLAPQVVEALRLIPRKRDFVFYTGQDFARFTQPSNTYNWVRVRDRFTEGLEPAHWLAQRVRDGGSPLDFYELRHHYASELGRRGVQIRDIALMMGHQDEGALARTTYVHVDEREAGDRVRAVLWADEGERETG